MLTKPFGSEPSDISVIPRFKVLGGEELRSLISTWLDRPGLAEVFLASLTVDASLVMNRQDLLTKLETRGGTVNTTLIVSRMGLSDRPSSRRWRDLAALSSAGVRVYICSQLHAKLFLFKEQEKVCWAIGSSNLTRFGLASNEETNIRGFHTADYVIFRQFAQSLLDKSEPLSKESFQRSDRTW